MESQLSIAVIVLATLGIPVTTSPAGAHVTPITCDNSLDCPQPGYR